MDEAVAKLEEKFPGVVLLKRIKVKGLPGSDGTSLRRPATSPDTLLVYSATTSPKLLRWMATFCPASTLSLSLTRCSTSPPAVARIGNALFPTKTVTSLPLRPIGPATMP